MYVPRIEFPLFILVYPCAQTMLKAKDLRSGFTMLLYVACSLMYTIDWRLVDTTALFVVRAKGSYTHEVCLHLIMLPPILLRISRPAWGNRSSVVSAVLVLQCVASNGNPQAVLGRAPRSCFLPFSRSSTFFLYCLMTHTRE